MSNKMHILWSPKSWYNTKFTDCMCCGTRDKEIILVSSTTKEGDQSGHSYWVPTMGQLAFWLAP